MSPSTKQEQKFFDAWLAEVKGNWNTPAGRDIVWRSRTTKAVPMLVKFITDKAAPANDKERYMRSLDFSERAASILLAIERAAGLQPVAF